MFIWNRTVPGSTVNWQKRVNLTLLWKEYQVNCSNAGRVPYQYTQFCDIYRAWAKKSKATMRIHHKPGDAMEVDWL